MQFVFPWNGELEYTSTSHALFRGRGRNRKPESGSLPFAPISNADLPAMPLDDKLADVQAQPKSLGADCLARFPSESAVKDVFSLFRRYADAAVRYHDAHACRFCSFSAGWGL